MGVGPSKYAQSYLNKHEATLSNLIKEPEFIQLLTPEAPALDKSQRELLQRFIAKKAPSQKTRKRQNPKSKKLQSPGNLNKIGARAQRSCSKFVELQTTDICLPPAIAPQFQQWKREPKLFFPVHETLHSDLSTPVSLYGYMTSITRNAAWGRLQQRFLTICFYKAKERFGNAKKESERFLIDAIRAEWPNDSQIESNLRLWIREGRRYLQLANLTGGLGVLFFLPDVTESFWTSLRPEKDLPLVASQLETLDIASKVKKEDANDLANSIDRTLSQPFESYFETHTPMMQRQRTTSVGNQLVSRDEACRVAHNERSAEEYHVSDSCNSPVNTLLWAVQPDMASSETAPFESTELSFEGMWRPCPLPEDFLESYFNPLSFMS